MRILSRRFASIFNRGRMASSSKKSDRLIWIDCEMTGLDVNTKHLVEIACLVTEGNADLTLVEEGPNLVINQPPEILESMDDWCKTHFAQNGLLTAIRNSKTDLTQAENRVLSFVQKHTKSGKCPLAGNTVSMDRVFLNKYMPSLARHIHYRTVDVSTVKELCRRWHPSAFAKCPPKKQCHRAMDDIYESVAELKYYQGAIFRPPQQ